MNFEAILNQTLSGGVVNQMSQVLGADESVTSNAMQTALPMLLGAMTHNSSTPEGASSLISALDRDHDGSILNDLSGFMGNHDAGPGAGILSHVFGDRLDAAQNTISQASGLDSSRTASLLMMLAPIVMGALGRSRQQSGLDESSLSAVLGTATQQVASNSPVSNMLSQFLDRNHDGSSLDDILRIAGNLFGRRG